MKFDDVRTVIWDCDGTIWSHSPDEIYIFAREMSIKSSEMISRLNEEFFKAISVFHKRFLDEIVKVNIKLIKKYKIELIKKFNIVFPENAKV